MSGSSVVIGPYKLIKQIGEGAVGIVYLAEQVEPVRRNVAVKLLKPAIATHQIVARFEAERQALALMDHPNIVRILDGGTTSSGSPYFVMELIDGVAITSFCSQRALPVRERLELFVQLCRAVQHAHNKGIIHRDLKPSDILVTLRKNRGTGHVKLIDFGVAKASGQSLTDKTLVTGFGAVVGTPSYMSPEQAGRNVDVDTRSDIYSLGVLLHELLTGETPKPDEGISTKLPPDELNSIVIKCMQTDPDRRYPTAEALALDVEHFIRRHWR